MLKGKYGVGLTSLQAEALIFVIGGYGKVDLKEVDIYSMTTNKWGKSTSL